MIPLTLDPWNGWILDDDGFLKDPAGNAFLPSDLNASFWARQLLQEQLGTPGAIRAMKSHLQREIAKHSRTFLVEIRDADHQDAEPILSYKLR